MSILFHNARVLTLAGGDPPRRGDALRDLGVLENGWVRVEGTRIVGVGPGEPPELEANEVIDAGGSLLMPAWVDCHTHACWAGSRVAEWEQRLAGASYLDILKAGGGIMSTVRAVRAAPEPVLGRGLVRRLTAMLALGTGALEIKTGYGLNTEDELKMLRTIHNLAQIAPQRVAGTFLGAHAIDPDEPRFVDRMISETLPTVIQEFPGIVCDAYCEDGAWSLAQVERYLRAAIDHGSPIRLHADQFNELGATRLAIELGAVSVDHLEASSEETLRQLAESATFGVMLPACGFHLDGRYAAGRAFVDFGGALALATNCNPGSAPTTSMAFVVGLACRRLGLTPAEAIAAATINAACVLGLQDEVGSIEPGKRADLQLLDLDDEREVAWEFAGPGPLIVVLGGDIVHTRAVERMEVDEEEEEDEEAEEGDEDEDLDLGEFYDDGEE